MKARPKGGLGILTCWDAFYVHSGKASEVARQLSLAGIAVVWIFRFTNSTQVALSLPLLWALLSFVASLGLDLLQHTYQSVAWGLFSRKMELRLGARSDKRFAAPAHINRPGYIFFGLKIALVIAGYIVLGLDIVERIQIF